MRHFLDISSSLVTDSNNVIPVELLRLRYCLILLSALSCNTEIHPDSDYTSFTFYIVFIH